MNPSIPVGPFDLLSLVGKGGMGEVWQGVHRDQGVPVAVKVITADAARQVRYLDAFRNEVRAVARLDHPGIVWVFDYGILTEQAESASAGSLVAGSPYLAMEYASGGTLHGLMKEMDWPAVRRVLFELLDALAHAHARGVIHRDLKPGNVLLARAGDVRPGLKLTDFGIARAMDFQPEETGSKPLGTLHYMAPEQVKAEWREQGPWTDLYAVGCMAYRLISGRLPFKGLRTASLMHAQISKLPPLPEPVFPVPDGLIDWIWTLIAKDPKDRFRRAADATHALLALRDPLGARSSADPGSLAAQFSSGTRLPGDDSTSLRGTEIAQLGPRTEPPTDPRPVALAAPGQGRKRARPPLPRTWRLPIPPRPSPRLHGAGLGLWGMRTVPLVGRETERDLLWNALREVERRRAPRLVVVRGPTGTGKTRLVEWCGQRGEEVGATILLDARCVKGRPSGHGLADLLGRALHTDGLAGAELLEQVAAALGPRGVDDAEVHRGVCATLSPDGSFQGTELDAGGRHAVAALVLRRLAEERPLYLLFDNAHYDPDLLAFARWARGADEDEASLGPSLAALIALVVRDEDLAEAPGIEAEVEAIGREPDTVVIELQNLKRSHRAVLVRELLGLEPVLAAQVERRTGGNPLFTIQLVSEWIAAGWIVLGPDGFTLRDPDQATLPRSLDEVWAERHQRVLAGLPADAEQSLERAAVLGERVSLAEWQQVSDDPGGDRAQEGQVYFRPESARTRHALTQRLIASALAEDAEDGLSFTHGMFRETILDAARRAGRLEGHHLAAARMLELRAEGPADLERRAVHLAQGGAAAEAVPMLLQAVEHRARTSLPAALELVGRAEEALRDGGIPPEAPGWGAVALARGQLYARLGRHTLAREHLDKLARDAREHGWIDTQTQARLARAELGVTLEEPSALDALRQLRSELGDAATLEQRVALTTLRCELHHRQGDLAGALGAAAEVVRLTAGLDEARQAAAWTLMGQICLERGELDEALALHTHAVRVFRAQRQALPLARALLALGETYRERLELRRAQQALRESLKVFRLSGSADVVHAYVGLGELLLLQESWRDAVVVWTHAARAAEHRAPSLQVHAHSGLVAATAGERDWAGCARHLAEAERASERLRAFRDRATAPMLEQTATWMEARQRVDLARRALRLARRLLHGTVDTAALARVEARLDVLSETG